MIANRRAPRVLLFPIPEAKQARQAIAKALTT